MENLFNLPEKLDRRKRYYLILDCETATLPFVRELPAEIQKKMALSKPLIYDLGWKVIDTKGNIYCRKSFIIAEIFSVPAIFETAYYKDKKPLYLKAIQEGETKIVAWNEAIHDLKTDIQKVNAVGAYNAAFDFFRAIKFTNLYISKIYSMHFSDWYEYQKKICLEQFQKKKKEHTPKWDTFKFEEIEIPLFDIWFLACKYLMNTKNYRKFCEENEYFSHTKKYYSSTAETAYRYITGNKQFNESHTAVHDSDIESEILLKILKKKNSKMEMGVVAFPSRIIGTVKQKEVNERE